MWKVTRHGKAVKLNRPVLIEGLPGIGNVGKIVVDFIIEELKAEKVCEFFSYTFPHAVFVNEENMVELPSIEMYCKRFNDKRNDLLLLAGDVQPVDEQSSYEFSEKVLDIAQEHQCSRIVTLGGIGLPAIPKVPRIYCTGNSKKLIGEFKRAGVNTSLYGVVGPIVGVSGLLLGLGKRRKLPAVGLLAETYHHPTYLGVKGAKELLKILDKSLHLRINIKELEREIMRIEEEMIKKSKEFEQVTKQAALRRLKGKISDEMEYIG
ncbi:MAG TPA: PAC2 family protein [Candidatus Nanoarchaeia archaeon]|nr:PAC2 family protein [Candidatus Nanoarchaeia archaeon]